MTILKLTFQFVATVLIPLLYLTNILIIVKSPNTLNLPLSLIVLGLIISLLGLIFWVLSYIHLGKSFGVIPQKQKKVKSGLYKYFNHPMYIGIFLTFLGLSLTNSSWQGLVFLNLIITPLLFIRAGLEDIKLTD